MRRSLVIVWLIAAGFCASTRLQPDGAHPPRLVLVLAIDQMRFDYLTRFDALYKGGLRMLLDRGAVFTNANYRHAATETGPGHSVILTGRHPSHSGIVANDWYDAYLRKSVNVVEDPVQKPLGGAGRSASPANALGFTVGDVLKSNNPESKVVGVSLKDRSAILMGGRRADGAYWYETAGGNFITSTYYMPEAPTWLVAWNKRHLADQYAGKTWTRLLPDAALYERYAGKDAVEGEWDRKDTVFPHAIRGNPPAVSFYDDLRRTPFCRRSDTRCRAGGHESASHRRGCRHGHPRDWLLGNRRRRAHLWSRQPRDAWINCCGWIWCSNDYLQHRRQSGPREHARRPDVGSWRDAARRKPAGEGPRRATSARPPRCTNAVKQAFDKRFPGIDGSGRVLFRLPDFYLNEDVIRERNLNREDVEKTAIAALLATGLVAKVYTHDDLRSARSPSMRIPC